MAKKKVTSKTKGKDMSEEVIKQEETEVNQESSDVVTYDKETSSSEIVEENNTEESDLVKDNEFGYMDDPSFIPNEKKTEDTPVEPVVVEPIKKEEPVATINEDDKLICSFNRGINNYLTTALDILNTCSVKEIDKIIRSRTVIYENFFNAISNAPSDAAAYRFISQFLNAIHERQYVVNKDRAMVGFMRLATLTNAQANMYMLIWTLLLDTSNPATRGANARAINWRLITPNLAFHKKGEIINQRLTSFYQQC